MNFIDIYSEIAQNKENHNQGYFNCIPFMGMERLERLIPGIEQDTYYLLTASSGVGKSKLARYLFIHNPYQYIKTHPESDIQLTIKYFSLEESKKKIILAEISKYLFTKYGLVYSVKQLQSRGRYNTIDVETLEKIKEAEVYVDEFLKTVDIVDSIRNPTGIYKYVRDFALTIGTYYDKNGIPLTPEEVERVKAAKEGDQTYKKISYYKKHNPKHYVIILTDHISLLQPEAGLTQWQTMAKYSSDYCLHMRDKFGFIPVNVQQQASAKEQVEYNYKGKSIDEKLEPSLDGLGDNKTTQRDANVVLGLFAPDRYSITEHNGYDVGFFKDKYRSLNLLKDRDGVSNKKLPLFFNGAVDFFKELPRAEDGVGLGKVYEYINQLNQLS
jgi:hypothetical protein